MERPTNQNAVFAMNQYLIYQRTLDEHKFCNEADRQKVQMEADYWCQVFEKAKDCKIIEALGLTVLE